MMKITALFFFPLLLLSTDLHSQWPTYGHRSKHFDAFDESATLNVVMTGDANMDEAMYGAFTEHWEFSAVEFITMNKLAELVADDKQYFFIPVTETISTSGQAMQSTRTDEYLVITRGGYDDPRKLDRQRWIFRIPMDSWNMEESILDMAYRLAPSIKLMNDALTRIKTKKKRISNPKAAKKFMEAEFSQGLSKLQEKTLLINSSNVRPEGVSGTKLRRVQKKSATEEDINNGYRNAFRVVDINEIASALAEHRKDTAVLLSVAYTNQVIMIFDAETHETLYWKYNTTGLSLKKKDYKKLR